MRVISQKQYNQEMKELKAIRLIKKSSTKGMIYVCRRCRLAYKDWEDGKDSGMSCLEAHLQHDWILIG